MRVSVTSLGSRVVVGLMALTFIIPALMLLLGPAPSRFGFQMYSGFGEVSATWQDAEGENHEVVLPDQVATPRVEVDWTTRLPPWLCRQLPEASSVEVRQTGRSGDRVGRMTCPT